VVIRVGTRSALRAAAAGKCRGLVARGDRPGGPRLEKLVAVRSPGPGAPVLDRHDSGHQSGHSVAGRRSYSPVGGNGRPGSPGAGGRKTPRPADVRPRPGDRDHNVGRGRPRHRIRARGRGGPAIDRSVYWRTLRRARMVSQVSMPQFYAASPMTPRHGSKTQTGLVADHSKGSGQAAACCASGGRPRAADRRK
jgi:hypothetical protein